MKDSPDRKELELKEKSMRFAQRANLEQGTLTLNSSAKQLMKQPPVKKSDATTESGQEISTETSYSRRNSLQSTLSTAHVFTEAKNSPALTPTGLEKQDKFTKSHSLSLDVSYDVVKGGKNSAASIEGDLRSLELERQNFQLQQSWVDLRSRAYSLVSALYITVCKKVLIEQSISSVESAVKAGEVKLAARSISQKDHLNFLSLKSRIELRLLTAASDLEARYNDLSSFSPNAGEVAKVAAQKIRSCEPDFKLNKAEVEATIKRLLSNSEQLPEVSAAKKALEVSRTTETLTELQYTPSVRPFIGGAWSPPLDDNPDSGQLSVGLRASWTAPFDSGRYKRREASTNAAAAAQRLDAQRNQTRSRLLSLGNQLALRAQQFEAALLVIKNNQLLLRATNDQQAIGTADVLTQVNAVINLIDAQQSRLDAWNAMATSSHELEQIAALSAGVK